MENVKKLERFVWGLGWFSGSVKLTITLESKFEGFSGKASEDWEKQVVITLLSPDETKCPNLKEVGNTYSNMDIVAFRMLEKIEKWKQDKF